MSSKLQVESEKVKKIRGMANSHEQDAFELRIQLTAAQRDAQHAKRELAKLSSQVQKNNSLW